MEARFTCKLCEKVSFCPQCKAEKMFKGHLANDHTDAYVDSNGQLVSAVSAATLRVMKEEE